MGNVQTYECSSFCGLGIFSSRDLGCTTLKPAQSKKPKKVPKLSKTLSRCQMSQNEIDLPLRPEKKLDSGDDVPIKRAQLKRSCTFDVLLREPKEKTEVTENDFRIMQILADGRYGKVFMAKRELGKDVFAMKILSKRRIQNLNPTESTLMEKELLEKANHPFIPKLLYSFENERNIFLVTEYIPGGEICKVLQKLTRFSEEITRFYSAEVLVALEYLHEKMKVTYNDLKPENILLDDEGHIRLIDYDFTKKLENSQSPSTSRNNLDSPPVSENAEGNSAAEKVTDFWKFGCFIYEMLTGKKLFQDTSDEIKEADLNIETEVEWPSFISRNARDLITSLLHYKFEGDCLQEIKNHAFFANINWAKVGQKAVYPPLNPLQLMESTQEEEVEEDEETEEDDVTHCSTVFNFGAMDLKRLPSMIDDSFFPSNNYGEVTPGREYKELQMRLIQ